MPGTGKPRSRKRFDTIPDVIPIARGSGTLRLAPHRSSSHIEAQQMYNMDTDSPLSTAVTSGADAMTSDTILLLPEDASVLREIAMETHSDSDTGELIRNEVIERNGTNGHDTHFSEDELIDLVAADDCTIYQHDNMSESPLLLPNWRVVWGILMTGGTMRMTKEMYQSMRTIADTFAQIGFSTWRSDSDDTEKPEYKSSRMSCLPHYSTLYRVFKPRLINVLAPRGQDGMERVNTRAAGARSSAVSSEGDPHIAVRTILPSEYARNDMATAAVFDAMRSCSLEICDSMPHAVPAAGSTDCVDLWPVVAARHWFYGHATSASADCNSSGNNASSFCERGDVVKVCVRAIEPLAEEIGIGECGASVCGQLRHIAGIVANIWTVHHRSRNGIEQFQPTIPTDLTMRDKSISQLFSFTNYRSPSDSVSIDIPEVVIEDTELAQGICSGDGTRRKKPSPAVAEALRLRRAAMREKKNAMERAWRNWKKPVLKPGDTVVMLRPRAPVSISCSRLCVVHRFWTEFEERSRHIFWIPSSTAIPQTPSGNFENEFSLYCSPVSTDCSAMTRDVSNVRILDIHPGKRGVDSYPPISSLGTLPSGEKYFIYRFLLYWDGFVMTAGKSASGDGFYLQCLNIPVQARASARAVRVISLTPPGVSVSSVFRRIQDDIIEGMTSGFLDYDADGQLRRIFLDVVGVIGDTPALNAELDTMGHMATAFCHLCRICRLSSTVIGNHYVRPGYHGSISSCRRGFYQHCAIRDSDAQKETCTLLGMRPPLHGRELPLHNLRQAMLDAFQRIPITNTGHPIVPGILDPYRGCMVAPDHLLTAHLRDCINIAFKLLPSNAYRRVCEAFLLRFLSCIQQPQQNRLFDLDKKNLFTMSMTEIYALSVVSEIGFTSAIEYQRVNFPQSDSLSTKSWTAVHLVVSCAQLIAKLWFYPHANRDGPDVVHQFERNKGRLWIEKIQEQTNAHLQLVTNLCLMPDSDFDALENPRTSNTRRLRLSKELNASMLAIKTIDRPNVHRIRELVHTTLPMVGHISRIGELVLEKAHQALKQGYKNLITKMPISKQ